MKDIDVDVDVDVDIDVVVDADAQFGQYETETHSNQRISNILQIAGQFPSAQIRKVAKQEIHNALIEFNNLNQLGITRENKSQQDNYNHFTNKGLNQRNGNLKLNEEKENMNIVESEVLQGVTLDLRRAVMHMLDKVTLIVDEAAEQIQSEKNKINMTVKKILETIHQIQKEE
ncbi:MAG: hypothetical protein EZS28_002085 [Streblomastix strix]|uniref:Uncharacterized protein n=1 Tax=Streblomastix strix TaxID=222440 RepID=A0A5J4X578_9EUKA|nr:MAG: hypothetical protein EZS28_002085 [Streblomastix strix]